MQICVFIRTKRFAWSVVLDTNGFYGHVHACALFSRVLMTRLVCASFPIRLSDPTGYLQVVNATHAHWTWKETAAKDAHGVVFVMNASAAWTDDAWVVQSA